MANEDKREIARQRAKKWYYDNRDRAIQRSRDDKLKRRSSAQSRLYDAARDRAKRKGIEFNITYEDIVIPDVCPVFKTPFTYTGGKFSATSYSLDRIDSTKGYVKGNIQVISVKANMMKNSATKKGVNTILKLGNVDLCR